MELWKHQKSAFSMRKNWVLIDYSKDVGKCPIDFSEFKQKEINRWFKTLNKISENRPLQKNR
jgi:hypothetical protein